MKHLTHITRYALAAILLGCALAMCGALESASAQERDPFRKPLPPKRPRISKDAPPVLLDPPPIQERIERYKAQKVAAMSAQVAAPKPTTALVLSEMQVTGIFRTPRGYAAMVEATPIKLSYVIYPGEKFFDGQLVAIEEGRLVFRREKHWSNGKREMAVETKPLRQPNPVMEMTTSRADAPAATPPAATPEAAVKSGKGKAGDNK